LTLADAFTQTSVAQAVYATLLKETHRRPSRIW
jgi:hypothetical protein